MRYEEISLFKMQLKILHIIVLSGRGLEFSCISIAHVYDTFSVLKRLYANKLVTLEENAVE
jgi:hypothetical protein